MAEENNKRKSNLVVGFCSAVIALVGTAATFKNNIKELFGDRLSSKATVPARGPLHDLVQKYIPEGSDASNLGLDELAVITESGKYDTYTVEEFLKHLRGRRIYWRTHLGIPVKLLDTNIDSIYLANANKHAPYLAVKFELLFPEDFTKRATLLTDRDEIEITGFFDGFKHPRGDDPGVAFVAQGAFIKLPR